MTIAETGSWAPGTIIGIIFTILLTLIFVGLMLAAFVTRGDPGSGWAFFIGLIAAGLIAIMLSPLALYPYEGEYHQYRHVSGTVAEVETRLVSSGDGMEEKFVVLFEGSRQEFRVDDTRAALVEEGDELTITCRRVWEYAATHGYVCKWIGVS